MLINKLFGGEHAQPEPRIEVQQAHVACALVQAGAGVALVDEITVAGPIWSEVVTLPIIGTVNAPVNVFHLALQPLSRLALAFIDVLHKLDQRG
jgi:DNA-binding transcriptional LysR family regulator